MAELSVTISPAVEQERPWPLLLLLVLYCVLMIGAFWATVTSISAIWFRSDTFIHCILIVPIAIWVAWRDRSQLAGSYLAPELRRLLFTVPVGFIWFLARTIDILVIEQLAFVALIVIGIWAIIGTAAARRMIFPLGFLFLAVPVGEELIQPMMEFTASSTVAMVRASGIPVYRDGLYFSLPSGNWSVIQACSGVRYLIASVTLGFLYAHLTFNSLWRKIAFVAASAVVPVLANSVRAYIIVMLGHVSNMKIATGVDHLIYGWIFFGLVMLLLFWVGSFWREDTGTVSNRANEPSVVSYGRAPMKAFITASALAVITAATWPVFALTLEARLSTEALPDLPVPAPQGRWELVSDPVWDWVPISMGADRQLVQFYRQDEQLVALYLFSYARQEQGAEVISGGNRYVDGRSKIRVTTSEQATVELSNEPVQIDTVELLVRQRSLYVWSWYRIGGQYTANRFYGKWLQLLQEVGLLPDKATWLVVSTHDQDREAAFETLESFLSEQLPAIEASLDGEAVTASQ